VQAACFVAFLVLFFYVCWPYGARHHAEARAAKEVLEAEAFLALDPLVSVTAALAARAWVWALPWAAALLVVCLVFPRGFCGYLCPFGTLFDLVDWAVGRRASRCRVQRRGGWVHLKYYLLGGTLVAAAGGVLLSGFVAAIPVLTRGLAFTLAPVQMGLLRGWYLVPPMNAGHTVSLALFLVTLGLVLLGPRFWCRCVCPSGAVFSLATVLRLTERKVTPACIACGRCVAACPFDAIRPDFTTRPRECTFCQTCGGACPVGAIQFTSRWAALDARPRAEAAPPEVPLSRRGFAASVAGSLALAAATRTVLGARLGSPSAVLPVRPPGSVPEQEFLQLCIRCGECFKACPFNVLQPLGFAQGLEGLWTPAVVADWSGCDPTCNHCGQVCPTGAIRALPLEEKGCAHMGLAVVDEPACLPHAGREACRLCFDECEAAGYHAIEFLRVHVEVDADGAPVEETGYAAPVVLAERCVGCGLCQTRCYHLNVRQKRLLDGSAIRVVAGPGHEDRLTHGSYRALREQERQQRQPPHAPPGQGNGYLPDFLKGP
jgi:ferredoxin